MKEVSSWPLPPITDNTQPPEIPRKFHIFNKTFEVIDNQPVLYTLKKHKILRKDKMKKYLESTSSLFHSIVKNIINRRDSTNTVTDLKNVHTDVNEYLNSCRENEALLKIKRMISDRNKLRNDNKKDLDEYLNQYTL